MDKFSGVPTLAEAAQMLEEAEKRNPGPWVQHSLFVAQAARLIAARIPGLDPTTAYILGCLHDIGRREGVTDMRHTLDGYNYLLNQGFGGAARICLTHTFPTKNYLEGAGGWDCTSPELEFVKDFLANIEYTGYDRLIQLCDSLALPTGFCLIEKRLVDVALRRGLNPYTVEKWKAFFEIQQEFERAIGESIYTLLPGVVNSTFGFDIPG